MHLSIHSWSIVHAGDVPVVVSSPPAVTRVAKAATNAIAIAADGVVTMDQIPVFSAGINVSGGTIAGTIGTAAQANITSVGTLTSLVVSGQTDLAQLRITGNKIESDVSNADITLGDGQVRLARNPFKTNRTIPCQEI